MTTDQESWEDLNEALVCGLLFRFGLNDAQLAELPRWPSRLPITPPPAPVAPSPPRCADS